MKIFNNFAKYKIKTNKVLNFPKLQVVSAKFDENNTMQLRNLKIRSILLNDSEICPLICTKAFRFECRRSTLSIKD